MNALMMVCDRTCFLRTTFGSLKFIKGQERLVAPNMIAAAIAIGVKAVDEDAKIFEEPEPEVPLDSGSRSTAVAKAIEAIYERNDPDDFTTGSSPKVTAVVKLSGLPKVSAFEIKAYIDARNIKLEAEAVENRKKKAADKAARAAGVEDPPDDDEHGG